MPSLKVWIALLIALAAIYICVHPCFNLQAGVLHKGLDTGGSMVSVGFATIDLRGDNSQSLISEAHSAYVGNNSDSLDLICVRIC
jgi:hypothetical protein